MNMRMTMFVLVQMTMFVLVRMAMLVSMGVGVGTACTVDLRTGRDGCRARRGTRRRSVEGRGLSGRLEGRRPARIERQRGVQGAVPPGGPACPGRTAAEREPARGRVQGEAQRLP